MSDLTGSTQQYENYMPSNQAHFNYMDGPPLNQTNITDLGHVYSDLPYHTSPFSQACHTLPFYQTSHTHPHWQQPPPSQAIFSSNTYPLDSDVYGGGYTPLTDYTNSLLNQPSGYVDMDQSTYTLCQAYSQPPSRVNLPSDTRSLNNHNVYIGGNTQSNPAHYRYLTMDDDLTNYNAATHHPLPQTLGQTPPTPAHSNNAGMASSRGYTVIIVNADINLERLLSIIRSCERE